MDSKEKKRLGRVRIGNRLITLFLVSELAAIIWLIVSFIKSGFVETWKEHWGKILLIILAEAFIFFIGYCLFR